MTWRRLFGLSRSLAMLPMATLRAAQGVRWTVIVGLDNTYKAEAWTPIFADVAKDGPSSSFGLAPGRPRRGISACGPSTSDDPEMKTPDPA